MKAPDIPIDIFVCYAHADERWVTEGTPYGLLPWLRNQLKSAAVRFWWDHGIRAGEDFERTINNKIDEVQIVILLISDDFAGSDYIIDKELPRIRSRYDAGEILVIPILISTISRLNRDRLTWVVGIQMLPNDQKGLNVIVNSDSWAETRARILDEIYHRICLFRSHLLDPPEVLPTPAISAAKKEEGRKAEPYNSGDHAAAPPPAADKIGRGRWLAIIGVGVLLVAGISWAMFHSKNDSGTPLDRSAKVALTQEDQENLRQKMENLREEQAAELLAAKAKAEAAKQAEEQQRLAEAAKAMQATKDKPFVNTLGMRFVPVTMTDGPSVGQAVLFSIWETRVQDYSKYATATNRLNGEWLSAGFKQGEDHPVANVNCEDAQAFCAWLTDWERQSGRLGTSEHYRLPTDHEWSCAVGIGSMEKQRESPFINPKKIEGVYPWGGDFPPRTTVGNYSDQTAELEKVFSGGHPIQGYDDGYAWTAPVGSFPPNDLGLFDLGGNLWEWTEVIDQRGNSIRALRGAAFNSFVREAMLSSFRLDEDSGAKVRFSSGVRCVLVVADTREGIDP